MKKKIIIAAAAAVVLGAAVYAQKISDSSSLTKQLEEAAQNETGENPEAEQNETGENPEAEQNETGEKPEAAQNETGEKPEKPQDTGTLTNKEDIVDNRGEDIKERLIYVPVHFTYSACPSLGDIRAIIVSVDFPDVKFTPEALTGNELKESVFGKTNTEGYPFENVTSYYERASYGNINITGDTYTYTAKHEMGYYEKAEGGSDILAREVLEALDGQIDYNEYDSNMDGVLDLVIFNVPAVPYEGDESFWYSATYYWSYGTENFAGDGIEIYQYIIVDDQTYDIGYFNSVLCHETGHMMGLPDYYLYEVEDWEGYHGDMGNELMDDACGDFSSFSKLMLGWLPDEKVNVYSGGEQEFTLNDASCEPSCIIIPRYKSEYCDYMGEYFIIEYTSSTENNYRNYSEGGVRMFHVCAYPDYMSRQFKYEAFSTYYDNTNNGIRITRLVNDGSIFYTSGDIITYGTENFAWYDSEGQQNIDPEIAVTIGKFENNTYIINISENK